MERAVGWFVFLATALLLFGFGYYIYHTAERKGWFTPKAKFVTYVQSSLGFKVGDPVLMMGFPVGQITRIHAMEPGDARNVEVDFEMLAPYFRYIRSRGSYVKVNAGFLGQSQLEVTRGTNGGFALCVTQPIFQKTIPELEALVAATTNEWQLSQFVFDANSNIVFRPYKMLNPENLQVLAGMNLESNSVYAYNNSPKNNRKHVVAIWREDLHRYDFYNFKNSSPVVLPSSESVPIADRLDALVSQVEKALPNILSLTNKISTVLDNAANATSNLNVTLVAAQPMIKNFTVISGQLREPGGLGVWALGTNGSDQVQGALTNLNSLLVNTDTNLATILLQLADLTSNLNAQVQANTNMLGGISKAVTDTDNLVQGLKRHWLLRSAFKTKTTNAPPTKPISPKR